MALIAVLFAEAEEDAHALRIGGIGIALRQCRAARLAKAERTLLIGGGKVSGWGTETVTVLDTTIDLLSHITDEDRVLVIAPGLIVDDRIISAVLAVSAPAVAIWPSAVPPRGVERIDPQRLAAGVAVYPGAMVRAVLADLGDWDLQSTMLRTALGDAASTIVDLTSISEYAPARRRSAPLIWIIPTDLASARTATNMIVAAAQKGCLDWPARFIHPLIENAAVRLLAPTSVTPNMVTVFTGLVGIGAGVAFACGWMWAGLLLALLSGPLDGVDGKLARTTLVYSRWGDLEHILDKICEYGWFLCIAGHFAAEKSHQGPYAVGMILLLFALAESLQGEFFRRFTGKQLDDTGVFERRFRLVSGRRNTFFWSLIPFGLFDAWYAGFIFLAVYSAVTFFVMQVRLFVQLERFGREISPNIETNFAQTAYAFLPISSRSSR